MLELNLLRRRSGEPRHEKAQRGRLLPGKTSASSRRKTRRLLRFRTDASRKDPSSYFAKFEELEVGKVKRCFGS